MKYAIDVEEIDDSFSEDDLIEAIQGRNKKLNRLEALKQFAKRTSGRKGEVYRKIVEDTSQSYKMRRMVALELGKEDTPENRDTLLQSLKTQDERVLSGVSRSLGLIGNEEALKQLESIRVDRGNLAVEDVRFAKHLIAYRLRLNQYPFDTPKKEELQVINKRKAIEFEARMAKEPQLEKIYAGIKRSLPTVSLSDKGILNITCRSTEYLLVFNKEFQSADQFQTLRKSSALSMVFLKKGYCPDDYFVTNYFFCHPQGLNQKGRGNENELALIGTRPNGTLAYSGTVKMSDNEYAFNLKAVKSRYTAALEMEGVYNFKTQKYELGRTMGQTTIDSETSPAGIPQKTNHSKLG